jgi:hypothetical protein
LVLLDEAMETSRADHINRDDPIWVWDGSWLPAVMLEPDRKLALVRFENGCSAPASWSDVEPRDPHGEDATDQAEANALPVMLKKGVHGTRPTS